MHSPGEEHPQIVTALWPGALFQNIVKRHQIERKRPPHLQPGKAEPCEGLENLRPQSELARKIFASWQPTEK